MVCMADTDVQNCATEKFGMAEMGWQAMRWFDTMSLPFERRIYHLPKPHP